MRGEWADSLSDSQRVMTPSRCQRRYTLPWLTMRGWHSLASSLLMMLLVFLLLADVLSCLCIWLTLLATFLLADTLSSLSPGWHYLLPLYRWHFLVFLSYADSHPSPDNPCLFILIADIYYLPPPNLLFFLSWLTLLLIPSRSWYFLPHRLLAFPCCEQTVADKVPWRGVNC